MGSFEDQANLNFPPEVIDRIHQMADNGQYPIRGLGARRKVPTFDDLVFLTASVSRYPLEGYRERCETRTVLGARHGARPLELEIPITIAGMSFGALSATAKEALGRAATAVGTSTTTGDGGMTPEERKASSLLVYQVLPSRYGFDPADLRQADAVEIVVGQGAKPGGGGMLLGQKVNARVAAMRTLPPGIDQRSASRHPDWVGPDDLRIKIEELREATEWGIPIFVKVGATRVDHDVKLAVAAGADVIVVDGMQGGTAATQDVFIEHTGIPTLPAVRMAATALEEIGKRGEVQLVISGGIRSGADVAKALALGADAVSIGVAALLALGCNRRAYRSAAGELVNVEDDYAALVDVARTLRALPHRSVPGRHHDAGSATGVPAGARQRRRVRGQLPARHHHGGHRARPRLRQVRRPPSRAGGPGRPHGRSCGDGQAAPRRHGLDPRLAPCHGAVSAPESADIVIVGAGVTGLSTARALVELGVRDVLVLDRATVGSGGSGKSSGIVRCHYGIRSLAAMAWHALPILEDAVEILGAESGYRKTGYLVGVGSQNIGSLRANVAMHRSIGIDVELVGLDAAQEMWPVADLGDFAEFAYEPRGGYGDGHQTALAFAFAARRGGARVRQNSGVVALERAGGTGHGGAAPERRTRGGRRSRAGRRTLVRRSGRSDRGGPPHSFPARPDSPG